MGTSERTVTDALWTADVVVGIADRGAAAVSPLLLVADAPPAASAPLAFMVAPEAPSSLEVGAGASLVGWDASVGAASVGSAVVAALSGAGASAAGKVLFGGGDANFPLDAPSDVPSDASLAALSALATAESRATRLLSGS